MYAKQIAAGALVVAVLCTGCAGPQTPSGGAPADGQPRQSRTLTMAMRYEVTDLAPKIPGSSGPGLTKRLFNAALSVNDGAGTPRPYLAEALPHLNTATWRVFPDGRMETTYRLRPSLTWQDGRPLTAEDFAFAFRVYRAPGLEIFSPAPENLMETVQAPDPGTVVIHWKSPTIAAGDLGSDGLSPLPRHLLDTPFADYGQGRSSRDGFIGIPFWTVEYVGAGPYRLTNWEPGSFLEGAAFDGHVLGRPKIDRLVIRIFHDENTVLAAVLAGGQVDLTNQFTLRFEHVPVLKREWEAAGKGTVLPFRSSAVSLHVQQRPEYVGDPALLDLRVRRALARTFDRKALNEGLFEGIGFPTETLVPETEPFYPDLDRAMSKYPPDQRRAEQLMAEAGFTRDRDGLFADATGRRFRLDYSVTAGSEFERGQAILADAWKRVGFHVEPAVLPAAQARDTQARHTFPGLSSRGGGLGEAHFTAAEVGAAANRWTGDNRSGWVHPEYERLFEAFNSTLDLAERRRFTVQMMTLVSEQLPVYPMYFSIMVRTWVASLTGPLEGSSGFGLVSSGTTNHWNVHEWEMRN